MCCLSLFLTTRQLPLLISWNSAVVVITLHMSNTCFWYALVQITCVICTHVLAHQSVLQPHCNIQTHFWEGGGLTLIAALSEKQLKNVAFRLKSLPTDDSQHKPMIILKLDIECSSRLCPIQIPRLHHYRQRPFQKVSYRAHRQTSSSLINNGY